MTRRTARPVRRLAVALVLVAVSCSDDDDEDSVAPSAATASPTAATVAARATTSDAAVTVSSPSLTSISTTEVPSTAAPCPIDEDTIAGLGDLTVSGAIAAVPSLSTLTALPGFTDRLDGSEPLTLFAPTDDAFAALGPAERDALLADPQGALAELLSLHLVRGSGQTIAEVAAAPDGVASAGGVRLRVTDDGAAPIVDTGGGSATALCPDLTVADGVIHVIDAVLALPPVDTEALGGTRLYTVDVTTAAVESLGAFGGELGVLGLAATQDDELLAVTDGAELITFSPEDPATITAQLPISGVDDATLLAIDIRPGVGELLGFSDAGTLYSIELTSGTAVPIGGPLDPPLDDPGFGFDVVPAGDLAHVVVATGTNVFLDASTGAVRSTEPPPTYAEGDANEGAAPRVVALASPSEGDPLAIDAATESLVRLGDGGVLTTVGALDVPLTDGASMEIAADGTIYVAVPG